LNSQHRNERHFDFGYAEAVVTGVGYRFASIAMPWALKRKMSFVEAEKARKPL
jgi:hypothetical protein